MSTLAKKASFRIAWLGAGLAASIFTTAAGAATTTLSDIPVFSAFTVPANLMLALSVEFPTGLTAAYKDGNSPLVYTDNSGVSQTIACGGLNGGYGTCYFPQMNYLGYFDYDKCYDYDSTNGYFVPISNNGPVCTGHWSGNMLNWATMTSLDEFRQSLTGGNRIVDTANKTVLRRANMNTQASTGNFPDKRLSSTLNVAPQTVIGDLNFLLTPGVYIRSAQKGDQFTISDSSGFNSTKTYTYNARVQVCVPGLLESNCNSAVNAGGYNKPEGLVQQNTNRVRVGAAGYAFKTGNSQPNGIVRALIRDNGPTQYKGVGARTDNPYKEWDATTGIFFANPDTADITGTAPGGGNATQSGAINFLNQFGYGSSGYETYDTVSELYWAALAYLKNVPLDATYTAGLNAGNSLDTTFPVLSGAALNDPVQYSCQGHAIVMIGDSHTHCDSRVPSTGPNSSGGTCSNKAPLSPLAANNTDPGMDAGAWVTKLGALPLIEGQSLTMAGAYGTSALGTVFEKNSTNNPTYDMAGMAYYAHTQDIRGDDPSKLGTKGPQNVDTYVVDVLEQGVYDGTSSNPIYQPLYPGGPNTYWLAAKYGGFSVDPGTVDGAGVPKPPSLLSWHTNTTTAAGKDLRPDNYFPGNRPDLVQAGLSTIFSRVASKTPVFASGPGTSPTRSLAPVNGTIFQTSVVGFSVYQTKYQPGDWQGDVIANISAVAADGTVSPVLTTGTPPVPAAQWSAKSRLESMTQQLDTSTPPKPVGWDQTRRVVTLAGSSGVPFRWGNLTSTQRAALNNDSLLLNFLRGDKSGEGLTYHNRTYVLGDIVDSQAVLVQGATSLSYSEANNPGYTAFKTSVASRAPVVYVGGNDGMLHAFAADFKASTTATSPDGGGSELFAYVPSFLFSGPSSTPLVNGLAALGNLTGVTTNPYAHHFYVDQTPSAVDVDFNRTGSNPNGMGSPDWHTLLVGAAGKGGKGIYALDVTTVPSALAVGTSATQEGLIKNKVLWEFAPSDMGFVYSTPLVVKTRKYGWVVMVTSGYNNASGKGTLYILNAKTGASLETMTVAGGTAANPLGLGRASAYTQDFTDNTAEQVYAGDLQGNVWRFDVQASSGGYPAPVLLATLTAPDGTPQPVTTAPRIEVDIDSTGLGTRRWVFVGTGRLLDVSDVSNTQVQTMYALRDGSATTPTSSPSLTRSGLIAILNLLTGVAIPDNAGGWYYDLPGASDAGATERVFVDPDSQAGLPIIVWATLIPTNDPCQYQGAVYAVNYGTGQSVLLDNGGNIIVSVIPPNGAPTSATIQVPPGGGGQYTILVGSLSGASFLNPLSPSASNAALGRSNWREIFN